ncbi:amidohydrolase family protein [Actinokineospora enzanensis]|uniref:amidohydrolase family protein n=1 Tax=Actinokineospora enzanensis TaxID=155975 RepID=UPI00035E9EBC|nr:amidohydrolase family protein [Actinokineospora enzanensis]
MSTVRPVLDFHARLAPRPGAADDLLSTMDACGIGRAGVAAGGVVGLDALSRLLVVGGHVTDDADNDAVLAACSAAGGRLVPYFFANPHRGIEHYTTRAAEFRAVEISPAVHGVPLNDSRVHALVEVARVHRHPVYTVCLSRPGAGVADLVALARAHREVTFVLGHLGVGLIDTYAVDLVAASPNVLVETSGAFGFTVRVALERLGPDRLLFAAEHPLQHPSVELAKYAALDLAADTWERIAWHNATRLLGEDLP